jgi:putative ATPase
MMDLFEQRKDQILQRNAPLADRMRPRTLDEYIGQEHIIGEGRLLRRAIQIDQLSSLIFYGPPGTGKTTLARIIANTTKAQFISINAVLAGVKDIREAIDLAQKTLSLYGKRTILFVDEVHRFNKAQQDALLPHVENGILILIGATTENPYFEVNKALVSRSRIFQLRTLDEKDLKAVAYQAINDKERGYGNRKVTIDDDAIEHLVRVANGDARGVLNALELAVETTKISQESEIHITREIAEESIQQRAVLYDRDGDVHYDTISAFIKSVRGSDPDAALYWMGKMVYAGEDPRFIFRRLIILACEDVGMADPYALGVVMDAAQAFDYVGMPEGRYHLAHACLYLATAPKSNSSMAFFDALNVVQQEAKDDVPNHLRDGNRDKEGFGHGDGYLYPHAYRDHWVAQQYLPLSMQGKVFYQPSELGYEKGIKEKVTLNREAQIEAMVEQEQSDVFSLSVNESDPERDKWLERTLGNRGVQLGLIREKILTAADLQREDLVLDLNARTGLLTFAASRQTPEGSVWAVAHDDKSYSTLMSIVSRMDVLTRPQLIGKKSDSIIEDICSVAGESVRFDKIVGCNVLLNIGQKVQFVNNCLRLLNASGKMVLAETVASEGQRISDLIDLARVDKPLYAMLCDAENELFNDGADPLVNWTSTAFVQTLQETIPLRLHSSLHIDSSRRRIAPKEIDYWFRTDTGTGRKSLGSRIAERDTTGQAEKIKQMLHAQLDNKDVEWKVVTLFMVLQHG